MPIGTFINMCAVLIGGTLGLILRKRFPENVKKIVFQGLGLSTLLIGMQMAFKVENALILIFSVVIGGVIGELIKLEKKLESIGDVMKKSLKLKDENFTEGLVTAFLLFCIGSMSVVGSLNEGISGDKTLILTKSVLDGLSSIALAATYGVGVMFSILPMLVFQGGITLLASYSQTLFSPELLAQLTATGGLLILGIAINLLEIKRIRVINMLPSLVVVVILSYIFL